jgi:ABC-2 type transport system ATP-binding protein
MDSPAIDFKDVVVYRGGRRVLHGIAGSCPRGQITGLFGPSGSGKSTLLRSLAGVQAEVSGSISVYGVPPGSRQARSSLGYKTQAESIYEDLTVGENVGYFAAVRGSQVGDVLDQVGLVEQQHTLGRKLSGGQRARVSLAAALVGDPRLLLLDEPTVGLDPLLRRELWRLFARLARAGTTLLISSHVLDEARHCDRLILLRDGRILAQLTPAQLTQRTGTQDMDEAFVRLIEASPKADRSRW